MLTAPEQSESDDTPNIPLEVSPIVAPEPKGAALPTAKKIMPWSTLLPIGLALIPALVIILLYLPVVKHQFVWDDTIFLRDMPAYRSPSRGATCILVLPLVCTLGARPAGPSPHEARPPGR